ncbi:MAG: hypothetical protein V4526_02800 [Patescibacteria group bacterium]
MKEASENKLIGKIENNLRFIITISIFFLALIPESKLVGAIIIAGYIANYIVFEIRSNKFSSRNLKWISTSLFVGIGSYAIPLSIIALSTQNYLFPSWELSVLKALIFISMLIIVLLPASTLVMTCFLSRNTPLGEKS